MPSLFQQGPTALSTNTTIPLFLLQSADPAYQITPVMREVHQAAILSLSDEEASKVWTRCILRDPKFPRPQPTPDNTQHPTSRQLLLAALQSSASQADLVLNVARESNPTANAAIEKLIGKPIQRPQPTTPAQRLQKIREQRGQSTTANLKFDPTHHVRLLVQSNPKRAGSDPHRRFDLYLPDQPVQLSLDAGVTAADVRWDISHNFIELIAP